ncbi:Oidioi.mRNA.OKI2018_I69.chr2.g4954.t1.cds [Oikopleura dioica]|uniref:Oidioi.mRNA.OKI2018_I69.chr2.g4954.t1.cds n=1 Tax=Oikopleura dioica TaxID=34765 RepID=A0ABN7T384_OIKDI|nr:Oidioi.mRNA.OKI2018_I69.chr2.g4954.t1.cds [Oikopleura dioica]
MEVEDRAKAKKLQEEADERCQQEAEEEEQGLDDTTLWLMDMVGVRPESTRRKATPIVFKITDAENIDRKFRKIFPAACGLFNIIYWGYCLNQD